MTTSMPPARPRRPSPSTPRSPPSRLDARSPSRPSNGGAREDLVAQPRCAPRRRRAQQHRDPPVSGSSRRQLREHGLAEEARGAGQQQRLVRRVAPAGSPWPRRSRAPGTRTTASTNVSVDGSARQSRARILEAARGEFAQHGFTRARLQDIAERAGLTHPTLLYHFGSKEGLYAAVIEQAMRDWAATTNRVRSTGAAGLRPGRGAGRRRPRVLRHAPRLRRHLRREAIEGGGRLEEAIAEHMRPFLDDAVAFLAREVAGRPAAPARPRRADAALLRRGAHVLLRRRLPRAPARRRPARRARRRRASATRSPRCCGRRWTRPADIPHRCGLDRMVTRPACGHRWR